MRQRTDQVIKLLKMTPEQIAQLKEWLMVEKITYKEAVSRLRERFNIEAHQMNVSNFLHRVCVPLQPAPQQTIIDFQFPQDGEKGLRVTVKQQAPRTSIFINGQILN